MSTHVRPSTFKPNVVYAHVDPSVVKEMTSSQTVTNDVDFIVTVIRIVWEKQRTRGPEVIKLFSCSTQSSTKYILLINVKMPTIVGILIFMRMINITYEHLKARKKVFIFKHFRFYEHLKLHAQFS